MNGCACDDVPNMCSRCAADMDAARERDTLRADLARTEARIEDLTRAIARRDESLACADHLRAEAERGAFDAERHALALIVAEIEAEHAALLTAHEQLRDRAKRAEQERDAALAALDGAK